MGRKLIAVLMLGLIMLTCLPGANALAAGEIKQPELTLDQAINMALRQSRALKSANIDIYLADENDTEARSKWRDYYATEYDDTLEPSIETRYTNLLNADYAYDSAVIKRDIQEDAIRAQTRASYYDLLQAIDSLALKKGDLGYQQIAFNHAKAYLNVGMLSSLQMIQANLALIQKQAELTAAEHDLNNSYINFNQLIGLDPEDRPVLTSNPSMEPLEVENLSAQISLIMNESPSLDLVDAALDMKEEMYWVIGMDETTDQQLQQAELNAKATKESVLKGLYSVYYSTKNLEDSYTNALQNLNLAQENLRIAKLKYDLGMNTKADVLSAENAVLQAQNSLLAITCNHEILKETFYKPWAA